MINLKGIFSTGADKLASSLGKAIDGIFTNDEERMAQQAVLDRVKIEALKAVNDHQEAIMQDATKQLELVLSDKQSAREMYKTNSSLQKIYALSFLLMYTVLACLILYNILSYVGSGKFEISEFGSMFISTLFGGMSAKLSTITDFLFGSGMEAKKP
jgi:hypothetical protein